MKQATAVLRRYAEPDATMRQRLRTMHAHYTTHAAAFQAFNPTFDAQYGARWLAALDAADAAQPGCWARGRVEAGHGHRQRRDGPGVRRPANAILLQKGQNTEDSDTYLTAQNLAYGFGQEVSAAAKILFARDAATLALFRLTSPAPTAPTSAK